MPPLEHDDSEINAYSKVQGIEAKIQDLQRQREEIIDVNETLHAIEEQAVVKAKWVDKNELSIVVEASSIPEELEGLMSRPDVKGSIEYNQNHREFKYSGFYYLR